MSAQPIKSLYVTLLRSFARTPKDQVAVLKHLGFTYRLQEVKKPNNNPIRGSLRKVRHLIKIEADFERAKRLAEEAEKRKHLPHLVLNHS